MCTRSQYSTEFQWFSMSNRHQRRFVCLANGRNVQQSLIRTKNFNSMWKHIWMSCKRPSCTNANGTCAIIKHIRWRPFAVMYYTMHTCRIWSRLASNWFWKKRRCPRVSTIRGAEMWFPIPRRNTFACGKNVCSHLNWSKTTSIMCDSIASTSWRPIKWETEIIWCNASGWTAPNRSRSAWKWSNTFDRTRARDSPLAPIVVPRSIRTRNSTIISNGKQTTVSWSEAKNKTMENETFHLGFSYIQMQSLLSHVRDRRAIEQSHVHSHQLRQVHNVRHDVSVAGGASSAFSLSSHRWAAAQMHPMWLWVNIASLIRAIGLRQIPLMHFPFSSEPSPNGIWINTFELCTKPSWQLIIAMNTIATSHAIRWTKCESMWSMCMAKDRTFTAATAARESTEAAEHFHGI